MLFVPSCSTHAWLGLLASVRARTRVRARARARARLAEWQLARLRWRRDVDLAVLEPPVRVLDAVASDAEVDRAARLPLLSRPDAAATAW